MDAKPDNPANVDETAWSERWPSERQLSLFIQNVQDYAIFMLDPRGHVVTWNMGAERLKGYTKHEVLGQHFSIFYTEDDRRRHHPEAELEIVRQEGLYQEEGWRRRKDGSLFYANVVITAVRADETGQLIGFGKVTRDLTQHKQRAEQERELQREQIARAEADAANRAKNDLLAVISHELRSPLTALLSYTDLMLAGIPEPVPDASRQHVERIHAAAHHLRQLIEQILTFSRIQLGQEEVQYETVDLSSLISETTDLGGPLASRKGLGLHVDAPTGPVAVQTDPTKLRQILWNLLANAMNYTETGEVAVVVEATDDELVIEVRDTGPGIPAEQAKHVFEPFQQANSESKRQGGTGLGLSVAKHLSELLGGSISLQSMVGAGSTFTVRLPRTDARS